MTDALREAGKLLAEITGSCPADLYGWKRAERCEYVCGYIDEGPAVCWAKYCAWRVARGPHDGRKVQVPK
jgi:hypothetical protein